MVGTFENRGDEFVRWFVLVGLDVVKDHCRRNVNNAVAGSPKIIGIARSFGVGRAKLTLM